jgi:hypothetical protein
MATVICERASVLHYMHITLFVAFYFVLLLLPWTMIYHLSLLLIQSAVTLAT